MPEPLIKNRPQWVEWPMWLAIFGLMVFGTLFIFSATHSGQTGLSLWPAEKGFWEFCRHLLGQFYFKQIIAYGLGITAAVLICLIDYHILARWSMVAYWVAIILLVAVMIPYIGVVRYGARRWIDFGFINLQPSELAKLAFILFQANFLSRPKEELRLPATFLKSVGLTALPFLLILKEPDLGSALVFLPIGLALMYVAGIPVKYLRRLVGWSTLVVTLLLANVLFAPPSWQIVQIEEYQRHRLFVYFGLPFAPEDASPAEKIRAKRLEKEKSYNVEQALISVASGGLTGKGLGQGIQNSLGFLPRTVAHNDFIFSVIAEESGFVGSVMVLAFYTIILFTGIKIAGQARDRLGTLMAIGVVTLLFGHVFINIGMNIRLMPVTGLPLPLLSYGGTSVVCSLIAIGILQNVYLHRRNY